MISLFILHTNDQYFINDWKNLFAEMRYYLLMEENKNPFYFRIYGKVVFILSLDFIFLKSFTNYKMSLYYKNSLIFSQNKSPFFFVWNFKIWNIMLRYFYYQFKSQWFFQHFLFKILIHTLLLLILIWLAKFSINWLNSHVLEKKILI